MISNPLRSFHVFANLKRAWPPFDVSNYHFEEFMPKIYHGDTETLRATEFFSTTPNGKDGNIRALTVGNPESVF